MFSCWLEIFVVFHAKIYTINLSLALLLLHPLSLGRLYFYYYLSQIFSNFWFSWHKGWSLRQPTYRLESCLSVCYALFSWWKEIRNLVMLPPYYATPVWGIWDAVERGLIESSGNSLPYWTELFPEWEFACFLYIFNWFPEIF